MRELRWAVENLTEQIKLLNQQQPARGFFIQLVEAIDRILIYTLAIATWAGLGFGVYMLYEKFISP